jgi:hypothetical protein
MSRSTTIPAANPLIAINKPTAIMKAIRQDETEIETERGREMCSMT